MFAMDTTNIKNIQLSWERLVYTQEEEKKEEEKK